ncbi:MAG: fluoride efflux transporter CrcB [Campylobacterales bacterium]
MITEFILVGAGGAAGSMARFACSLVLPRWLGSDFPYATTTVNLLGSFIALFFLYLLLEKGLFDPRMRLLVVTGFLGGFTTFSTFAVETLQLVWEGEGAKALFYWGLNTLGVLLAGVAGWRTAQWLS